MTVVSTRRHRVDGIPTAVIPAALTEPLRIPAHWAASAWAPAVAGVGMALVVLLVSAVLAPIVAVVV